MSRSIDPSRTSCTAAPASPAMPSAAPGTVAVNRVTVPSTASTAMADGDLQGAIGSTVAGDVSMVSHSPSSGWTHEPAGVITYETVPPSPSG